MTVQHISNAITVLDVAHAQPRRDVVRKPDAPDATVLKFLHRNHNGSVSLERRVDGEWQTLGNVKASHIGGLFSDEVIAEACQVDAYFSLHGMHAAGNFRRRTNLPKLDAFRRDIQSVRWLTCFHVDLDAYKVGMDSHAAIAAVMRLVDAGTLPPPSLFTTSRGAWCIWLLIDQKHSHSPLNKYSADDSTLKRWAKVQMALHKVCATIGSDPVSKNAGTCSRIPGSINSKNAARVSYSFHVNAYTGEPYQYTLPDMESLLLCHQPALPQPVHRIASASVVDAETRKAKRRGWHGRWQRVSEMLRCLRDMRGGWKVGQRSSAIFYASIALKALHATPEAAKRELLQHLDAMEQPVGDTITIEKALQVWRKLGVQKNGGVSHQTIADALNVSPDEAALLSVHRRMLFPFASRFGGALPPAKLSAAARSYHRRKAIKGICETAGVPITGALVQQHLEAIGLGAAPATVLRDMKELGYASALAHKKLRNRPR